jgi:hypothetical protein
LWYNDDTDALFHGFCMPRIQDICQRWLKRTFLSPAVSMQHRLLEAERQNVSLLAQLAHVTAAAQAQLAVASAGGQHMQLNPGLMPMMGGSSLSVGMRT